MARVLIIEPDRRIRAFIAGILADFGHQVQQCEGEGDARQCLGRAQFDVLATDLVLHDPPGAMPDLAERLPVLTLSGRPFVAAADKHDRPSRLDDKPFRFADLHLLVAALAAPAAAPVGSFAG